MCDRDMNRILHGHCISQTSLYYFSLIRVKQFHWSSSEKILYCMYVFTYDVLLPKIMTMAERRVKFRGHDWRSKNETIYQVILGKPRHSKWFRGRPSCTFIDQLVEDTNIPKEFLPKVMEDRNWWRRLVMDVRLTSFQLGVSGGMHSTTCISSVISMMWMGMLKIRLMWHYTYS